MKSKRYFRNLGMLGVGASVSLSAAAMPADALTENTGRTDDSGYATSRAPDSNPCAQVDLARYGITEVAPRKIDPTVAARFDRMIEAAAREHHVPASLIRSVVSVESAFKPEVRSIKGAIGLMQVMPATGKRFGATNLDDPEGNLGAGTRYLRWLMDRFDQDLALVLAAYNAGEGAVKKYANSVPPYPETRDYVARVLATTRGQCNMPPGPRGGASRVVTAPAPDPTSANSAIVRTKMPIDHMVGNGAVLLHAILYGSAK